MLPTDDPIRSNFRGYADFYRRGPYASFLREQHMLGSNGIRLLHVEQPAGDYPDPAMPEYFVYVALQGAAELSFDWGCGRWSGVWQRDDVSVAPPNVATDIHVNERHAFLALAIPAQLVDEPVADLLGRRRSDLGRVHAATFRHRGIANLIRRFSSAPSDAALAQDCRLLAVVESLVEREAEPERFALDDERLRRVVEYIDAHPGSDVRLATLARTAGLSAIHFARQFRHRIGLSPHRYVQARRIARLRGLLRTTGHPLHELAYELGFASQSHMTATFSRATGTSPARFRRQN